jgi:hypothetical protein
MTDTIEVGAFPPNAETGAYGAQTLPTRRWTPGAVG